MVASYDRRADMDEQGARRRRQKGRDRLERRRRYRKNRSKAKRRQKQYRSRNKAKIKRYEKKRRRNPSRHRLLKAGLQQLSMQVPFEDLDYGLEGIIDSVDPDEELVHAVLDTGATKDYDILDFLDTTVLLGDDDSELFQILDQTYEYEPEDEPVSDEEYDMHVYSYDRRFAAAPSKGQKFKDRDDEYKVVRVFPTKDDADGPLPKGLLRLIKKGGGAAMVELLPSGDYKLQGDMLVSPTSSRPRYYVKTFGPSGSWEGSGAVALKPAQVKRINSYR